MLRCQDNHWKTTCELKDKAQILSTVGDLDPFIKLCNRTGRQASLNTPADAPPPCPQVLTFPCNQVMHLPHQGLAERCQRLHTLMEVVIIVILSFLAENQCHYYLIQIGSLDVTLLVDRGSKAVFLA